METDKTLNSAESIAIIQNMIAATRSKYERGGGMSLLTWGYTSLFVGFLVVILYHIFREGWVHLFWWLIPIIGLTIKLLTAKKRQKQVTTYVDKFVGSIWLVTGIMCGLFPLMMFVPMDDGLARFFTMSIIPFEGLILSMAVCMTGSALDFRPMIIGGAASAILSLAMFAFPGYMVYMFMLMFVVSMIIPGHILNYRGKCSKN